MGGRSVPVTVMVRAPPSDRPGPLLGLLRGAGINILGQKPPSVISAISGLFQAHVGVGAERQHLLLAVEAVLHPEELRAVGIDEQEQPFSSASLKGLSAGLAARMLKSLSAMSPSDVSPESSIPPAPSNTPSTGGIS